MLECLRLNNDEYCDLKEATDWLQWDCFLEGRISPCWIRLMKPVFLQACLRLPPEKWGQQFIKYLLQITHKQWIFQNSGVHCKGFNGLTQAAHNKIFNCMEELIFTDPDYLLPKHQHLMSQDLEALTEVSAVDRQYWIVSVESAISASKAVQEGRVNPAGVAQLNFLQRHPWHRSSTQASGLVAAQNTSHDLVHTNTIQQRNQQQQNNELFNYPSGSTIPRRQGHPPVT